MGRRRDEETPGAKAERERLARQREDEDYRRRTGMTRQQYLAYLRDSNRRRNVKETSDFRRGKAKHQAEEVLRDQERARKYDAFIRRYGSDEAKAESRARGRAGRRADPDTVKEWWNTRGSGERWIGPDSTDSYEAHPKKPAEKPRRESVGEELIGGTGQSQDQDRDRDDRGSSGGGWTRGAGEALRGRPADPPPDDNGGDDNGGGIGFLKGW